MAAAVYRQFHYLNEELLLSVLLRVHMARACIMHLLSASVQLPRKHPFRYIFSTADTHPVTVDPDRLFKTSKQMM